MKKYIRTPQTEKVNCLINDFFRESTLREIKNRQGVILVLSDKKNEIINQITEFEFNIIQLKYIEQAREYIKKNDIRLFIMNMYNNDEYGIELLEWICERHCEVPVIVVLPDEKNKYLLERQFPQFDIMIEDMDTCTKYKKVINLDKLLIKEV